MTQGTVSIYCLSIQYPVSPRGHTPTNVALSPPTLRSQSSPNSRHLSGYVSLIGVSGLITVCGIGNGTRK